MKQQRFSWKSTILFYLVIGCLPVIQAYAAEVPKMSKEDLQAMMANPEVVIVDVRAAGDWTSSNSKIKGAVREDPSKVEPWIDNYSKDKTLVFYCS